MATACARAYKKLPRIDQRIAKDAKRLPRGSPLRYRRRRAERVLTITWHPCGGPRPMRQDCIPSPTTRSRRYRRVMDLRVLSPVEVVEADQTVSLRGVNQRTARRSKRGPGVNRRLSMVYTATTPLLTARRSVRAYMPNLCAPSGSGDTKTGRGKGTHWCKSD